MERFVAAPFGARDLEVLPYILVGVGFLLVVAGCGIVAVCRDLCGASGRATGSKHRHPD